MFVRVRQLALPLLLLLLTACATVRTTPGPDTGPGGPTASEPRGDGRAAEAFPPADRDGSGCTRAHCPRRSTHCGAPAWPTNSTSW